MAQAIDSDVDRAIAGLAGLPIPYRIFTAVPATQVEPDQAAVVFPLLIAALPDFAQLAMPPVPIIGNGSSHNVQIPIATAGIPGPVAKSPGPVTLRESTWSVPTSAEPAPFRVPSRHAPPQGISIQPHANDHAHATPLMAVFRHLNSASPSHQTATEPKSGLQNLFGRL